MSKDGQYELGVSGTFVAQHRLVGGDFGRENEWHSHHYRVEVRLAGPRLGAHGFLLDIVAVRAGLEETIGYFRDRTLNDLPEFEGLNPSLEHFVRIFTERLLSTFEAGGLSRVEVRLWEDPTAWAGYSVTPQ